MTRVRDDSGNVSITKIQTTANKFNQRNKGATCLVTFFLRFKIFWHSWADNWHYNIKLCFFMLLEVFFIDSLYFHSIQIFYLSLEVVFIKQKLFLFGTPRKWTLPLYCQCWATSAITLFSRKCSPASSVNNASKILNYCVNIFFVRYCKIKR